LLGRQRIHTHRSTLWLSADFAIDSMRGDEMQG
jgi:hypothetical protein